MELKFTISGLRGIWNYGLDPGVLCSYTRAFLSYLGRKGEVRKIVIGRDTRKTSPLIKDIVSGVVRSCGVNIVDLGVITTPMVLFITRQLNFDGGMIITASHNPPEWNAIKFVDKGGVFISQEGVEYISNLNKCDFVDWDKVGGEESISVDKVLDLFFEEVRKTIDISVIKERKFKVAFDPVNGAGYYIGKKFLERLGCKVVSINDDYTLFPQRDTEPIPNALSKLSEVVVSNKCDVGFALDPDGDRLALVLDNGVIPGEEYTLPIAEISAIKYVDRKDFSKKIVVNLSTSLLSEYVGEKFGFEVVRSKVGEANVVQKLSEVKGFIGGEGNGGVVFPIINPARDSFVGMVLVLYLIAKEGIKLSEIVSEFPRFEMIKLKTPKIVSFEEVSRIIDKICSNFILKEKSTIDGSWFRFDLGWIHIRPSNTEPITRIIFEGSQEFVDFVGNVLKDNEFGLLFM